MCQDCTTRREEVTKTMEGNKKDYPHIGQVMREASLGISDGLAKSGLLRFPDSSEMLHESFEWSLHQVLQILIDADLIEITEKSPTEEGSKTPELNKMGVTEPKAGCNPIRGATHASEQMKGLVKEPTPMPGTAAQSIHKEGLQETCLCKH